VGFVLVTGTGSGVGKTWVTRGLARTLQQRGLRVLAVKPVEVGCDLRGQEGEDGAVLARTTGQAAPRSALVRFGPPLAPALAAGMEAEPVDFDALLLQLEPLRAEADLVLLEGTGGLLTPITWEWNMADVARSLGAAALVVGADRRGTINHTLLTLSALELAGLPCLGVVLTTPGKPDASTGTNAAAIARLSGIDRVVALPSTDDDRVAAEAVEPILGWLGTVVGAKG
jgi:dethiobiotin synthetase